MICFRLRLTSVSRYFFARFDLMNWKDYGIMRKTRGEATMSIESKISADVCTFHISSPIHIVLYGYPEYDYLNPNLKTIMDTMGIYIDAEKLFDFFFDQLPREALKDAGWKMT